jgi:hypothetical protein
MEKTKVIQKRNVVMLNPEAMKATLELRHRKERILGQAVTIKEIVTEAVLEKYARDIKEKEVLDKIY